MKPLAEPLGWFKLKEDHHGSYYIQALPTEDNHNLIPLYTQLQIKEQMADYRQGFIDGQVFARELLRKAQNK